MVETTIRIEGMRGYPQGEPFLLTRGGDDFDALVYNTTGHNMYQGLVEGVGNLDPWN